MKPTTKLFIAIAIIVAVLVIGEMLITHYYVNRFSTSPHAHHR